ncbi:MAG: hypothetical protein ABSA65_19040 [Acidimicrobiales bacterium]
MSSRIWAEFFKVAYADDNNGARLPVRLVASPAVLALRPRKQIDRTDGIGEHNHLVDASSYN